MVGIACRIYAEGVMSYAVTLCSSAELEPGAPACSRCGLSLGVVRCVGNDSTGAAERVCSRCAPGVVFAALVEATAKKTRRK